MPQSFDGELTHLNGSAVLEIRGEIDMATAPAFRRLIERTLTLGVPFVVDLERVTFMDSSGLAVLALASQAPVQMSVRRPSAIVRRMLELTELSELIL